MNHAMLLEHVRRAAFAFLVATAVAPIIPSIAQADGKRPTAEAVHAAQVHMTKARALYEAGKYTDAIAELETARALDPYAKDLVFNLGIVHEKAAHFDDALHFYKLYLEMDLDPSERARAESIVKRLEGARVYVQPTATPTVTVTATAPPPPIIVTPPAHGRLDGLTVTTGILALGGFGVGAGFGIAALGARPPTGYVTGTDPSANGTYAQLKSMQDNANTLAIIADIGFLTGIVFTTVTLAVFFGRTKRVNDTPPRITFAPQKNGFVLGGVF